MMLGDPWDHRFMDLAGHISTWSKDPSTKVGAVVVSDDKQILSIGWNGFPRGIEDTDTRLNNRTIKYDLVCHEEKNAIYNATHNGVSLKNGNIYIHGMYLCPECAKGIIQCGIKAVMVSEKIVSQNTLQWQIDWMTKTVPMLAEAQVMIYMLQNNDEIIEYGYRDNLHSNVSTYNETSDIQ